MRIATFNANSVRKRLDAILEWIGEYKPDVLAIQETKVEDAAFPRDSFEEAGLHVAFHGMKSYNGVALVSRQPIESPFMGFGDPLWPDDCRILSAEVNGLKIINTYVPNGTKVGSEKFDYKIKWLDRFAQYLAARYRADQPVVWLGDINIAPTPLDVFDSPRHLGNVGHHPAEFEGLKRIVDFGLVDVYRQHHQGQGEYTFWEFVIPRAVERDLGWRIDHIYATVPLAAACVDCQVDKEPRLREGPSDHTFVYADFDV